MRYAIFGDIHANWEALMTVMGDAQEQQCTNFVCVGDVVGYNANPTECLEYVKGLNCPVVKGNHDEEATQDRTLDELNPLAESALLFPDEETKQRFKSFADIPDDVDARITARFTAITGT